MADDSPGLGGRSALIGAGIAGGVSVIALTLLTVSGVGSPTLRIIVAIVLGVGAAQLYERRLA